MKPCFSADLFSWLIPIDKVIAFSIATLIQADVVVLLFFKEECNLGVSDIAPI